MYMIQEIDGTRYTVYPSAIGNVQSSSVDKIEEAEIVEECETQIPVSVFHIEPEIYEQLSYEILERIEGRDYIKDVKVEIEKDDVFYELKLTALVYRRKYSAPDYEGSYVSDVVPVWWELHTFKGESAEECLNDGKFDEIRKLIRN